MTLRQMTRSKTVWSGLLGAAVLLLTAEPVTAQAIGEAIAMVLAAVGVRDAIHRGPTSGGVP